MEENYNKTEARRKSLRKWQETHHEHFIEYGVKYRKEHKDEIKEYQKKYNLKHRHEKRLHGKAYWHTRFKKQPCIICNSLDRVQFRIINPIEIELSGTFQNLQWLCYKHFWTRKL